MVEIFGVISRVELLVIKNSPLPERQVSPTMIGYGKVEVVVA
jgi:hypothetical protein